MKADKGKTIVIIYKQDYISKMMDILQDDTKFKEAHNDNTRDRFKALQGWYRDINISLAITIMSMFTHPPRQYPRYMVMRKFTKMVYR